MTNVNGTTTAASLASILNASTDAQSNKTASTAASALSSKSSSSTTTTKDTGITDTVTLSDAAKAILNSAKKNYGYTLTKAQQDQIKTVLDKYKDAELTDTNFGKIQADLKKLKLDTATLAIKDKASSFSPMRSFLAILRGKTPEQLTTESTTTQQAKKKQFETQLLNDWQVLTGKTV